MKILVVTNSCTDEKYKSICEIRKYKMIDPQQKFFRLFIDGLGQTDGCDVEVLSALPVSASTVDKYIFGYEQDINDYGTKYHYLPFFNGRFTRYISLTLAAYVYTKKWCQKYKHEPCCLIVDPLMPVLAIPSKYIAKQNGIKSVAIVTDIPTLATKMKERKGSSFKEKCVEVYENISDNDLKSYDAYITLTESINDKVNINNKPHCIVEGFADSSDTLVSDVHDNYLMYAGGIFEKYGVKNLVEAFIALNRKDIKLYIFGEGTYVEELLEVCKTHSNVKYMGCVTPDEVVEYEKKALLLINPRPTNEEFAKYSFPSKTMEYLLSGTAVVSTKLPGIPEEYFNYMFAFDDYGVNGIQEKLKEILSLPLEEINSMGRKGHDFVISEKSNRGMANKIYDFLERELL